MKNLLLLLSLVLFLVLVFAPSALAADDEIITFDIKQYQTDNVAATVKLTNYLGEISDQAQNKSYTGGEVTLRNISYVTWGSSVLITKAPNFNGSVTCAIEEYSILKDGSITPVALYRIGINEALREEDERESSTQATSTSGNNSVGQINMGSGGGALYYFVDQTYIGDGVLLADAEISDIPTKIEFLDYSAYSLVGAEAYDEELGISFGCSYNFGKENTIYRFIIEMYPADGENSWQAFNIGIVNNSPATTTTNNSPAPAPTPAPSANSVTAATTSSTVLVNGKNVAFDAYNIGGNNYFKLRDIAKALNGSAKQFEVGWDAAANAITLTSGKAYTAVGGELASGSTGSKQATPTASKIYLDGKEVQLTAYNISNNNYFKLRDLGQAFNFAVDWDNTKNTITIDTSKGYTPEGGSSASASANTTESATVGATVTIPATYKYTYLKNFPTVIDIKPLLIDNSDLDPNRIALVEDTPELVVYSINLLGLRESIEDVDTYFYFSDLLLHDIFYEEGFENVSYTLSEDDNWHKYTIPGSPDTNTFTVVSEKDNVRIVYIANGGGEDIDIFVVTKIK